MCLTLTIIPSSPNVFNNKSTSINDIMFIVDFQFFSKKIEVVLQVYNNLLRQPRYISYLFLFVKNASILSFFSSVSKQAPKSSASVR